MRYKNLKYIFQGDLCQMPDCQLVWTFMLAYQEDALVEHSRLMITGFIGLEDDRVNAAIDHLEKIGWLERIYPHLDWAWRITEKAHFPIHSERLVFDKWREMRSYVFERDDYTCQYCNTRGGRLECDHVIPISRGGTNEPDNLVTACATCNRSKRAKSAEDFRKEIKAHV